MESTSSLATCSNPGCDQPGTNLCSACKSTPYCGPICQTADWTHHREECPGHLLKLGMANIAKAEEFHRANNWPQTLRFANLAVTKLKQLKDRPVEHIHNVMKIKSNAFGMMGRHREGLECAKEWYLLYPTNHTHPPAIEASLAVIQACCLNNEWYDALLYARTLWETITMSRDSHIPDNLRDEYTARGARELARALWNFALRGGVMPPKEKQETGVEAIMLARRALAIHTQLYGAESLEVAGSSDVLANCIKYFNPSEEDEVIHLFKQALSIYRRLEGNDSPNVTVNLNNLGIVYNNRGARKGEAGQFNQYIDNLELALPSFRDATRIARANNLVDLADKAEQKFVDVRERLRLESRKR